MSGPWVKIVLLCGGMLLAACGGNPVNEDAAVPERESLDRSARLAFAQGRHAQAATLYEAVLQRALAADSTTAIIDARFNLALCQTYLGDYQAALAQTELANAERRRRGLADDPELQLLVGTIQYRQGDFAHAQATLTEVLQHGDGDRAVSDKAHFVAGLIAAELGSLSALRMHMMAMQTPTEDGLRPDHLELHARLLALEGDFEGALRLLDRVAVLRSDEHDYRGMTRALATAGGLAEQAGRLQAAGDYFFRAGRSAAHRAEPDARAWLERAKDIARRTDNLDLMREAESLLRGNGSAKGP